MLAKSIVFFNIFPKSSLIRVVFHVSKGPQTWRIGPHDGSGRSGRKHSDRFRLQIPGVVGPFQMAIHGL